MIDFSLILQSLPNLLKGALASIQIAVFASCIGFIGGVSLGLLHSSRKKVFSIPTSIYVTIFRGTPMLVQIIIFFYVLPLFHINLSAIWAATMAIGFNSSAYVSQIIRSGVSSVPQGQIEAGKVLGLSRLQINFFIVLPQAFRTVLPALGNEFITLIKDSSLASIIGVIELSKQGSIIRSRTYDAFSILLIVALIYLVITSIASALLKLLGKKIGAYVQN